MELTEIRHEGTFRVMEMFYLLISVVTICVYSAVRTPKDLFILLRVKKRKKESELTQSCPTLCDPMDCSPLGSSVHGIFQARILEWVAISFSRGSFQPRD